MIDNPFGVLRIVGIPNNSEMMPDPERVKRLIDAQDTALSDIDSELASMRLAYLVLKDVNIESDQYREFAKQHALLVGKDGSIEFLTKNISIEAVKWAFETAHKLIFQMSDTVDLNNFIGGSKTVSEIKTLLLDFETK